MSLDNFAAEVRDTPLADALGERYLAYALSTIMARSLPDVRDGLKPVHRRILFAMRELKLDPGTGFKKCARIVGDVMGKYHPHGNDAIYDAMVRLAQDFAERYPLVDGQGNFGNIDGDNPAAMRYTEARMTEVSMRLLDGIDENAVDFRATYDGELEEPVVLPAAFPNLLANGAAGIAVGMATNIPPHNVAEICACLERTIDKERLKDGKVGVAELVRLMPGPDFPTGGVLIEPHSALVEAYKTGRGALRLRARWREEKTKGGGYIVIVDQIPYQVQKGKLIEQIAALQEAKKLPLLGECRDELAEDVRIVIEPRARTVDVNLLMEHMFRQTDLEIRFGLNMNVLDAERTPKVMGLPDVLRAFLDHRQIVLRRRSEFRLGKIKARLHLLDGYMIVYLNLDEVIRIIREDDDPKARMMRKWKLSDEQAEAILNMRLRQLRKLDEIEIKKEIKTLKSEQAELKTLLGDDKRQWGRIRDEIAAIKDAYGPKTALGARRTALGEAPPADALAETMEEALTVKEPVTVLLSAKGWIRAVGGHLESDGEVKYKEGDESKFVLRGQSTDRLFLFASDGRGFAIPVDKVPRGRGFGEPLRLYIELGNEDDIVAASIHDPERKLLIAATDGRGFVAKEGEIAGQTKNGKQALNLGEGAKAAVCVPAQGDHVAVIGDNRKLLIFPLAELPEMARGRGITLQKYHDGGLAAAKVFALEAGLEVQTGDRVRAFSKADLKNWLGERAQAGRVRPDGFPRTNRL